MFTHLVGERAPELNDLLTHGGFRRSQSIAYRPAERENLSIRRAEIDAIPTRGQRASASFVWRVE